MPGIVGLTQSDAESRLQANGFSVGTVTQQNSDSYAKGVVISQSPSEGSSVTKGSSVSFVVSSGPAQQQSTDDQDDNSNTNNNNNNNSNSNSNSSSSSHQQGN